MANPAAMIGFSDAGAHLRNMAFYNFPLRMLKRVRDAERSGRAFMTVDQAVHKLTADIADFHRIDAGRLEVGSRADLVVIDPARLDDTVEEVHEAPMEGFAGAQPPGATQRRHGQGRDGQRPDGLRGRCAGAGSWHESPIRVVPGPRWGPLCMSPPATVADTGSDAVDAYVAELEAGDADRRRVDRIVELRATLAKVLPHAEECIKYQMPTLVLHGKNVAHYAAFANHYGYFPGSGSVLELVDVGDFDTSKGGLRVDYAKRLPVGLVRRLVKARLAEISAVTDGERREYYPDGALKAEGRMRDGDLHGKWRWYRADGSLMRTGQFVRGQQTGTWTTYDRADEPTRSTTF